MRATFATLLMICMAAPFAAAQSKPAQSGPAYRNEELGLSFDGVYGWEKRVVQGSAAWTELASYRDRAYDAVVSLAVRDNPYANRRQLREAIKREFSRSGEPAPGKPAFKEIALKDVKMRGGLALPGLEVQGYMTRLSPEGKKREYFLETRTYLGKRRLFRVACTVRRSRARRVRDLLDRAVAGLTVTASEEKVRTALRFTSERGGYSCTIPEGFAPVLPAAGQKADMRFQDRLTGTRVSVFSYAYDGELIDHVEEMQDYYGDAIEVGKEKVSVLGGPGFSATITKGEWITLVAGTVRNNHVFRVHTTFMKKHAAQGKRTHEAFLKGLRATR